MKLYVNFFYTSVLFILIVFCAIEYHNNDVLESRINSLNKNSIDFNSEKTFKEDYYIKQQSSDTTMLLTIFAILISFSGVFTYLNVVKSYRAESNKILDEVKKQYAENESYHKDLVLLESELNFQIGLIYSDKAVSLFNSNFNNGLMMSFCSMEKYALNILSKSPKEQKEESLKMLHIQLIYLNKLIKDNDLFHISSVDFNMYKDRIARITKVLDNDKTKTFNRIISKIEII